MSRAIHARHVHDGNFFILSMTECCCLCTYKSRNLCRHACRHVATIYIVNVGARGPQHVPPRCGACVRNLHGCSCMCLFAFRFLHRFVDTFVDTFLGRVYCHFNVTSATHVAGALPAEPERVSCETHVARFQCFMRFLPSLLKHMLRGSVPRSL